MSLIRKALWPTAIALGLLVFLGAIGQGNVVQKAAAASGDPCTLKVFKADPSLVTDAAIIDGKIYTTVDETNLFWFWVEDPTLEDDEEHFIADIDLDDETGDSDITSVADSEEDIEASDTQKTGPTDFIHDVGVFDGQMNVCGDTDEEILASILDDVDFYLNDGIENGENCWVGNDPPGTDGNDQTDCQPASPSDQGPGESTNPPPNHNGFNDWDIDCGYAVNAGGPCSISTSGMAAASHAIAAAIFDGNDDCDDLGMIGETAYIFQHPGGEFVAYQIHDYVQDTCGDLEDWFGQWWLDGVALIDVTCEEAGEYDLSFSPGDNAESLHVTCVGEVDDITLTAYPNKVEIVPAMGSVSYSLIVANLLDEDGAFPFADSITVDFKTNKCVFLDEDGVKAADFDAIAALYDDLDVNDASTAAAINAYLKAIEEDPDDDSNKVAAFNLPDGSSNKYVEYLKDLDDGDAIAVIILDCTAFNTVPGVATVTAEIDQEGADIIKTVSVTVVGPPVAPVAVAADQTSVVCGDRATITVTVKDAAGQPVSDHTLVEAVSTFGGVLGGTGAVAGNLGFVVPVSSTLAETFNGVATFFLLTSDTHVGAYDVTVSTGGSGSVTNALGGFFSTPVVTGHVTVSCAMPAAAPAATATVTAPRTGQGITPPNTGDAGLADSSESGLSLLVIAGVVAFALAGVAGLKLARR